MKKKKKEVNKKHGRISVPSEKMVFDETPCEWELESCI